MLRWIAPALGSVAAAMLAARVVALDADLSNHLVAITTAFSGTDVLLFGAVDEQRGDIAVVVRGPVEDAVVRRMGRVGFIWLTTDEFRFRGVPGYYAVASSKPLSDLASHTTLVRHELSAEYLKFRAVPDQGYSEQDVRAFRDALIRNKERQGLYAAEVGQVSFLGRVLFRTRLAFPANVPPGSYQVQVLHFREGNVVNAQVSPLGISKIGLEAELFEFSQRNAALYGLLAIALATLAGWSASVIFRRR
jgi:uncharacterized protein (TIGR02186 family)